LVGVWGRSPLLFRLILGSAAGEALPKGLFGPRIDPLLVERDCNTFISFPRPNVLLSAAIVPCCRVSSSLCKVHTVKVRL